MKRLLPFSALLGAMVLVAVALIAWLRTPSQHALVLAASPAMSGGIPGTLATPGHSVHLDSARGIVCTDCHELAANGFTKPKTEKCQACHQDKHVGLHQSALAKEKGASECSSCHAFVPRAGEDRGAWSCMRCHSEQQGTRQPIAVHAREQCGTCHKPHETPATKPADCRSCHDGQKAKVHIVRDPKMACADCHKPHEKAPRGADACTGCHFSKPPVVAQTAIFSGGHKCTSCHSAHDQGASVKQECKTCHAQKHVIGMERVPEHASCRSCHNQHNVLGGAGNACVRCHTGPHKGEQIDVSRGCTTCHNVHGAGKAMLTAVGGGTDCTSCHKIASNNRAFHDGRAECAQCHATHGSSALGPKQIVTCEQCHAKQTALASTNAGHTNCKSCHVPHQPLPPKQTCNGCHAVEAQTAPKGHAKCQSCHEPHSGSRPACTTCHANKVQTIHGNIASGCQSCHRAHGPKGVATAPACTTCHAQAKLPALHAVAQHSTCTNCHQAPHQPARAERATCLSCHVNRTDHEKDAARCTGCHNFKGAR